MPKQSPPDACPVCGSAELVRILWGYSTLAGEEREAVETGRALLGLNRRYFTSTPTTRIGRAMGLELSRLPGWVCLNCSPRWREVHRLAVSEIELEASKSAAVNAQDFERAAALWDKQRRFEEGHADEFERLITELINTHMSDKSSTDR
jgi:hypothetical protein